MAASAGRFAPQIQDGLAQPPHGERTHAFERLYVRAGDVVVESRLGRRKNFKRELKRGGH